MKHARILIVLALAFGCATGCSWTPKLRRPQASAQTTPLEPTSTLAKKVDPAEACLATARELHRQGRYRNALGLYAKACSHRPELRSELSYPIAVLSDRLDAEDTEDRYREAVAWHRENKPDSLDRLLNDYGCFLTKKGRYHEAFEALEEATSRNPKHKRAAMNLAVALIHLGDLDRAFETMQPIVGDAAAHANVGAVLAQQGQTEPAQDSLRQAVALAPELSQPVALLNYLENESPIRQVSAELDVTE